MPVEFDPEYHDRILTALTQAVIKTSMNNDRACVVQSAEVAEAALDLISMFTSASSQTSTPAKRREFADRMAKKLIGKLVAFQAQCAAEGGFPGGWVTLNDDDTAH